MNRVPLTFTIKTATGCVDIECNEVVVYQCPFCRDSRASHKSYTEDTVKSHLKEFHQLDVQ